MNKPSISLWKSTTIWTRLGVIWSTQPVYRFPFLQTLRFISLCQMLFAVLGNLRSKASDHQNVFHYLTDFVKTLEFSFSGNSWPLLAVLIFYFLAIYCLTAITISPSSKGDNKQKYFNFFGLVTTLHAEVFYYPLNKWFSELLSNLDDDQIQLIQRILRISVVLVLLCLNVTLTLYKTVFCYSRIRTRKFISRKSSFHLLGILILKLFLPFFQSFVTLHNYEEGNIKYDILGISISLAISVAVLLYTMISLPEYDLIMTKIHIIFHSITVFVCFGQLLAATIGNYNIVSESFLLVLPFWVKLSLNIFQALIDRLKIFPNKISNIDHLQFLLKEAQYPYAHNLAARKFTSTLLEKSWIIKNLLNFDLNDDFQSSDIERKSQVYLKGLFESFLLVHSKNVLGSLNYAKLILNHFRLYSKSYSLCVQVSRQRISVPDRISIYYLLGKIQETLNKNANGSQAPKSFSEAISLDFKYDILLQDLKSQFLKFTEQIACFWQILQEKKPNINALFQQAKGLEAKRFAIEATWKHYESEFSAEDCLFFLLYGVLKVHFLNMPCEGTKYIERFNSLIVNKKLFHFEKMKFNRNEYGTIMISGDKKNLGQIIHCSDLITEIFSTDKKELIEKNVNIIMPKFFQEHHHQILLNYYESGESKVLGQERLLYGKDLNYNIFPISLFIGIYFDSSKGIIYTGLIKKIKDQNQHILFTEDGNIEETSAGIRQITGIEPCKKVNINSVCSDFNYDNYKKYPQNIQPQENVNNEAKIIIQIKTLASTRRPDGLYLLSKYPNIFNTPNGLLEFTAKINSYSYGGKLLNAMRLEPNDEIHKSIKDLISSQDNMKNNEVNLNQIVGNESIDSPDKKDNLRKSSLYETGTKMTDYKNTENPVRKLIQKNSNPFFLSEQNSFSSSPIGMKIEKQLLRNSFPYKRSDSSFQSQPIQNKMSDDLQKRLVEPHPNRFRKVIINLYVLTLITFLTMVGIQYIVLKGSAEDIRFTTSAIRISYDKLTSLSLIWWYSKGYQGRLDGLAAATESDLDRYKLRLRTKREEIKKANDDLMRTITAGQNHQIQKFFAQDITLVYDNSNEMTVLDQRKVNSFEAINIIVEKMIKFDATPHKVLRANKNPDLKFVTANLLNDLLVSCEGLADMVQNVFTDNIQERIFYMNGIFYLNLIIGLIIIILSLIILFANYRQDKMLSEALLSIHPQNIELIISKTKLFSNYLKKNETILPQALQKFHQHYTLAPNSMKNFKFKNSEYEAKGVYLQKIKQTSILILLILCISVVASIRHISSSVMLDDVLTTNNQIIIAARTRHIVNLSYSTLGEVIATVGRSKMRNKPVIEQLMKNINDIPSTDYLFESYTDKDGQYIDYNIGALFKGKPCSFVVNFPGSLNDINCPLITQNGSIGMLALYSYTREELFGVSGQYLSNMTPENSLKTSLSMSASTSPKINVINGALMFVIDFLSQKLDNQISSLLEDAQTKLVFQILLIVFFSFVIIWFLLKKIFDDSMRRTVLKVIPFEETLNNNLLKNFIRHLYKERIDSLDQRN